jgi:hypothetical protein
MNYIQTAIVPHSPRLPNAAAFRPMAWVRARNAGTRSRPARALSPPAAVRRGIFIVIGTGFSSKMSLLGAARNVRYIDFLAMRV